MRIVSKFHDFYDSASVWRDETLCYVRNRTEKSEKELTPDERTLLAPVRKMLGKMPMCQWANRHIILFCGKTYPCYVMNNKEAYFSSLQMEKALKLKEAPENEPRDFWTGKVKQLQVANHNRVRRSWWSINHNELTHEEWAIFERDEWKKDISDEIFRYFKTPVLEIWKQGRDREVSLVLNPLLRDRNFATQADPYTAFQELSMFVGNNLVEQMDHNIQRTDELIRDSKGMDEWSFRKMGKNSKRKK